jgi:hypothetical protein
MSHDDRAAALAALNATIEPPLRIPVRSLAHSANSTESWSAVCNVASLGLPHRTRRLVFRPRSRRTESRLEISGPGIVVGHIAMLNPVGQVRTKMLVTRAANLDRLVSIETERNLRNTRESATSRAFSFPGTRLGPRLPRRSCRPTASPPQRKPADRRGRHRRG